MPFIIYISKTKPPSNEEIQRLISIHWTPQDDVTVKEDSTLDKGFRVVRSDRGVIEKSPEPELKEYLNIKHYKFKTKITAKENEQNIKEDKLKSAGS
jgi:hypothetical protein